MQTIAGFILAGGESRRMVATNRSLVLNGENFCGTLAAELATVTSKVTVVGKETNSQQLRCSTYLTFFRSGARWAAYIPHLLHARPSGV